MPWPATSAAAARIRRSRRRSARGKTDPHREGGRGPLRGGLARRRRGRARAVADGPARDRRAADDADRRPGAGARRSRLHRGPEAAGNAPHRGAALAARARTRRAHRSRPGACDARRPCGRRPGRPRRPRRRVRFPGRCRCGRVRRHLRAGAGRRLEDRGRLRAARGADWTPTKRSPAGSCSASLESASEGTSSGASPRRRSS